VGLVGAEALQAANAIANCGASEFFAVTDSDFCVSRYGTDAAAATALCQAAGAGVVLAPATARWSRVLPGVAYRLNGRADTHCTGLKVKEGAITASRWYYRKRMEACLRVTARPWLITLEPGCGPVWQGTSGQATLKSVVPEMDPNAKKTEVMGIESPAAGEQTIRPDAALLFVAGAGWTKPQKDGQTHAAKAKELILRFLQVSQASLGGSKSLVDLKAEGQAVLDFMSHLNQIGQTGSTPRHPKGLSTCCHGEEPHTIGWRFVNERRAISLDPNCGWAHDKADVLYVADAFEIVEKLNAVLEQKAKSNG
jgi:electron transfer flavoprotein alpha subunit